MTDGFVEKRDLMLELSSVPGLTEENYSAIRRKVEEMPCANLMERDIGKEPVLEKGNFLIHEERTNGECVYKNRAYLDWKCPTCGWYVGELYSGNGQWHVQQERSYCARCGQKIDWTKPKAEEKRLYEEKRAMARESFERELGIRLDNMNERKRKKYGIMKDVDAV